MNNLDVRINTASDDQDDPGLTETQRAMRRMRQNVSVISNPEPPLLSQKSIDSPLKSRKLSVGRNSRHSTPKRYVTHMATNNDNPAKNDITR